MDIAKIEMEFIEASEHLQNIINLSEGETNKEFRDCIDDLLNAWNNLDEIFKYIRLERLSKSVQGEPESEQT